ncbi:hydroxymethylglutaryl-CoA lyase [Anaeromyxobacter paludicola]|uniref:Hydroxymethylglutaryl-CoA lyase n=1 Tax=Anaeromyxobacter paludicola TaxID=2918171 RepID=A0ABN6N646_9BACT|nr:hydroxymethylglutaryl-CoA lyase [Anaeromyxobacter paludicola]BDG07578.1 hydroxymethylglutaryl-CoA lyase [Anaeromyxobacter paludicola]
MAPHVTVYEVGPRDGLQNEPAVLPLEEKLELVAALAAAGLQRIEAGSFVSPRWIPQLADSDRLVESLPPSPELRYVALVPNAPGLARLRRALDQAGANGPAVDAAVFVSASETHNRKNVNKTIDETFAAFDEVVGPALAAGLRVRGYVSTAFGCPYEGPVDPGRVIALAQRLLALGCYQVSLGDTVGLGTPNQVRELLSRLLARTRPEQVALHMHDTRGCALANVLVGLEAGLATFDASIGGLGGCPYAPGASGNLATEDLVHMLLGMGYETGISWERLVDAGALAQRLVGRALPGKALQAELAARTAGRTRSDPLASR